MKYNERLPTVWALEARTVGFLRCRIRTRTSGNTLFASKIMGLDKIRYKVDIGQPDMV